MTERQDGLLFSSKDLARLVEQTVPPDRTNAIVGTVDSDGAAIVVKLAKPGSKWMLEMAVRREWGGDLTSGAKVVWSW